MKFVVPVCLAVLCVPAWCQLPEPGGPVLVSAFPQLTNYLQLTDEQSLNLAKLMSDWNQYLAQKRVRVAEVNRELDDVAKQDTLDPLSFGTRDTELESICREAKDRRSQYQQKARGLLTPEQGQKLQVLEQAFALVPVIYEAQNANMMGRDVKVTDPKPVLGSLTGQWGINPNFIDVLPGCRPPSLATQIIPIISPTPFNQASKP